MSISVLHKMLCTGKNFIKINQDLLKILDIEQAALYSYLVSEYQKSIRNEDYKYFDNKIFIFCPVEEIENALGLSAFRQRGALSTLQDKNLLKVKLGKSRARYIWINDNTEVLEYMMYNSKFGAIKADFEKYVNEVTKKLVEKFSSKDNRNIDPKYLFEVAKKSDLYNQFSEMGIGWLSQIEENKKVNIKDLVKK